MTLLDHHAVRWVLHCPVPVMKNLEDLPEDLGEGESFRFCTGIQSRSMGKTLIGFFDRKAGREPRREARGFSRGRV